MFIGCVESYPPCISILLVFAEAICNLYPLSVDVFIRTLPPEVIRIRSVSLVNIVKGLLVTAPIDISPPLVKNLPFNEPSEVTVVKIPPVETPPPVICNVLYVVIDSGEVVPIPTFPEPFIRILSAGTFPDPVVLNVINPCPTVIADVEYDDVSTVDPL